MELNQENIRKIKEIILFTAVIIVCLWKYETVLDILFFLLNILTPFILGGAIAFVLNVPMNFVQRHLFKEERIRNRKVSQKLARPVSMVLVLIAVFGIVAIVMFILIPQLGETFANLGRSIQAFIPQLQEWAARLFNDNKEIMDTVNNLEFDWNKIMDTGINFFKSGAGSVVDSTITAAKSIVSGLTTFFIAFVFACYILLQKEKLGVQVKKVMHAFLKEKWEKRCLKVCTLTSKTFSNFLTGQCLEALILGSMFFVAMSLFKMPYALLVGVLVAFTALIPIFGAFIGCVVGAFLILMVDPLQALFFVIMFLVLQQIEGNLIYPKVVGNSVGLPSIWVLAAVTIGGSLMGVVGMLIFIPLVSVVYTLFRESVYKRLEQKQR